MPATVEITLRNMRFHARVGVLPHESEFAQPLEIDVTVWAVSPPAGTITLDYRDVYAMASEVVAKGPLLYLETVAQHIVAKALGRPDIRGARVAVRKPHVSLAGPLDYAEVVIEDGTRT